MAQTHTICSRSMSILSFAAFEIRDTTRTEWFSYEQNNNFQKYTYSIRCIRRNYRHNRPQNYKSIR